MMAHLFFRSRFRADFNLSISIQRLNVFSPGLPCKNSLKSSKPSLMPWQQIPQEQSHGAFLHPGPPLRASKRLVLSSTLTPSVSSWTFPSLLPSVSLQPAAAEARHSPSPGALQLRSAGISGCLRQSITVPASLNTWLARVETKHPFCSSEDTLPLTLLSFWCCSPESPADGSVGTLLGSWAPSQLRWG